MTINKIFQIGLNKCGTCSLHTLFKDHAEPSIRSIHWNNGKLALDIENNRRSNEPLLKGYDEIIFFSDMEAIFYDANHIVNIIEAYKCFKILDQQYPNSKFILNIRNIDNWINSRLKHTGYLSVLDNDNIKHTASDYSYKSYYMNYYSIFDIETIIKIWKQNYEYHLSSVREYFLDRPNDLIEYNIETDSFDKLKSFFSQYKIHFTTDIFPLINKSI